MCGVFTREVAVVSAIAGVGLPGGNFVFIHYDQVEGLVEIQCQP